MDSTKRRSQGSESKYGDGKYGDSKYGFSTSVRNSKSNSIDMYAGPPGEVAEELPLPPPPGKTGLTPNGTGNGNVSGSNIPGTPNTSSSGSLSLQNNSSSR